MKKGHVTILTRERQSSCDSLRSLQSLGAPNDDNIKARYNTSAGAFSQFIGAEMMHVKYGIGREAMDAFAARSHARAAAATAEGR